MSGKTQYRVLADYEVNDPHPLCLAAETGVTALRTDNSWPGWLWVDSGEQTGWIPESYLEKDNGNAYQTIREFKGTELSARRNEILTSLESESGWIYAESASGENGWFPLFNLRPHPKT